MNCLECYEKTLDIVESKISKLEIKTDKISVKAAAILFSVALDHAQGIKVCLVNSAYPSAFSLLRVLFEAYMRAMWLEGCANEMQINCYMKKDRIVSKNNKTLHFGDMVLEVEASGRLPVYFSEIKNRIWDCLNSLTHSGAIQLNLNFNGNSIQHSFDSDHLKEATEFSAMLACMSFAGLCDLATNVEDTNDIDEVMAFVLSWAFK